jgi:hypothetical protein
MMRLTLLCKEEEAQLLLLHPDSSSWVSPLLAGHPINANLFNIIYGAK